MVTAQSTYIQNPDKLSFQEVKGILPVGMPNDKVYSSVEGGETIPAAYLNSVYVYPKERFNDESSELNYWKLVRDVKKVYPLSKIVYYTLYETMNYLQTLPDEKSRQKHLRRMEKDLVEEYEPVLRKMSYNQGKILIKLIYRECNYSSYDLIKAYRGSFSAGLWQGVAKIFRADLKSGYDANNKDQMIERIVRKIDQGQL